MADIIQFDPNTGKKLNPGQSVIFEGKTYTQGQPLPTTSTSNLSNISSQVSDIAKQVQALTPQVQAVSPVAQTPRNDIQLQAMQSAMGVSGQGTDYQSQMANLIKTMQEQGNAYTSALQSQQTPEAMYSQYSQQLGIPEKQQAMTSVQTKIQETNNLIDNLERNLSSRLQSADANITEAQRLRQLQAEQKPYQEQLRTQTQQMATLAPEYQSSMDALSQMMAMAQQGQQQQLAAAKAPMEMTSSLLPYYQQMLQYQSPQDQLAQQIAYEQQMKDLGLGGYSTGDTSSKLMTIGEGQTIYDPNTGQAVYTAPKTQSATATAGQTIKSGGLVVAGGDIAQGQQGLNQTRGNDGYANTANYLQMLTAWTQAGGLQDDFFRYYPPTDYLNPNDPTVPAFIKNKIKQKTTSSEDELKKLFGL